VFVLSNMCKSHVQEFRGPSNTLSWPRTPHNNMNTSTPTPTHAKNFTDGCIDCHSVSPAMP